MDTLFSNYNQYQLKVLSKFHSRLEKEKFINEHASNYYMKCNRWFIIPGIIITGCSSIISFLSTSEIINNSSKTAFSITVGILTAGSAILQSIATSCGFDVRTEAFSKSADAYDSLITKVEFELYNPNEEFQSFCNSLEEAILKIKNDCKFLPPLFCHLDYYKEIKRRNKHKNNIDSNTLSSILIPHDNTNNINNINNTDNYNLENINKSIEDVIDIDNKDTDELLHLDDNKNNIKQNILI